MPALKLRSMLLASAAAVATTASIGLAQQPADNSKPGAAQPAEKPAGKPDKQDAKQEAPAPTLKVGDKAPAIKVDKWVKGEAVTGFEKGRSYVVEFWATWCPPCRTSIPHLTELQKQYKDIVFIGVTGSERKPQAGPDNRLENLEKFVKDQADKMDYKVAYDSDREMVKDWMEAAGQNGIPTAFLVDGEGKIAWIGHPMKLDDALKDLTSGKSKKDDKAAKQKAKKDAQKK